MNPSNIGPIGFIGPILLLALLLGACGGGPPRSTNSESTEAPPSASPQGSPLTGFQKDLHYIRNGQFNYVWVFSRKDGKPFDKDDGDILHKNAPHVVDWVGTDGGKRYIAGTNYDLEPEAWKLLRKRFVVEDYSGK